MTPVTATQPTESIEEKFKRLAAVWEKETAYISSTTAMIAHPAYQEIIRMGRAVLPALLRELERTKSGHWSAALEAITGANPIPEEDAGRIRKIAEAWLHWAKEQGYQW